MPISEDRENDILNIVTPPITDFEEMLQNHGVNGIEVGIDLGILDECFIRIELTLDKDFDPNLEPSEFKVAGSICYWFKRLQPFKLGESSDCHPTARLINEIIGILTAYELVFGELSIRDLKTPRINSRFFNDFLATLRYNQQSPQSLSLLFEAMSI